MNVRIVRKNESFCQTVKPTFETAALFPRGHRLNHLSNQR